MQGGKVWLSRAEAATLPAPWDYNTHDESEAAWLQRLSRQPLWSIDALPRVTVDRVSSASAYYEVGRVTYAPGAGLALLVRFNDEAQRPAFAQLLTLLGESGLGGRRSSGYGAFAWELGPDLQLDLGTTGTRVVLLSRYLPHEDELVALRSERAAYQLVRVGGWVYSMGRPSQRRQRVMMVSEGAVLDTSAAPLRGRVADVRPVYRERRPHPQVGSGNGTAHPVYRSGLALSVPIADEEATQ
jgi:CRISPR-associated protein Csm4